MFKIALQLYSLKEQCAADLDVTLAKVKAAGYDGVETFSLCGLTADEFKARLTAAGLACHSMHVGLDFYREDIDKVINDAVILEANMLVIPWSDFETADDVLKIAEFVRENAGKVSKAGLKWLYHNHDHEHRILSNGQDFYDVFLKNTDKTQINLQVDTYWVEKGGAAVASFIERVRPRIGGFHLKDEWEVGAGEIDFPLVLKTAKELGHEWVVVEQEAFCKDPFESIRISAEYVRAFKG